MRRPLTRDEIASALDRWSGRMVSVRIVTESAELIAVFCGELGERSHEKRPAHFWPLGPATYPRDGNHAERPGVYLHPERFEDAAVHVGGAVIEVRQDGVTLNIRRLDRR
jgi:hypothetical protein